MVSTSMFVKVFAFAVLLALINQTSANEWPSGLFSGACFFDDHFGKCPNKCKEEGKGATGGHCHDFKCICTN
uniref:Defensin n=1 Tax=Panagrolaimus davidi TaxID=227884 RepID=A0A914QU50_9BILA